MDLHPKVIDLTLDRVLLLLKYLGNPQLSLPPVIHIAGTNGKGSTQAMIRAGLEATGKLVHAYTSPHLAKFHERIRIAGKLITEEALTQQLDTCYEANNGQNITYFEITTCAALRAFSQVSADYTILEVGLGGRLDATNVVNKPAACIITPIDLDHQQFLGDTISKIAFEKAGILKQGVTAIIGPQHDEAREIIEKQAAKVGAPLLIHGQDWHVDVEAGNLIYQDENGRLDLPLPSLPGPHQIENAGAAIATVGWWSGYKLGGMFTLLIADYFQSLEYVNFWPITFICICSLIIICNIGKITRMHQSQCMVFYMNQPCRVPIA